MPTPSSSTALHRRLRFWLAAEFARFSPIRAFIAGIALLAAAGAAAFVPPADRLPPPTDAGPAAGRALPALRLREEAVERTIGALRGVRRAALAVAPDGLSAAVAVLAEPGRPLPIEGRAAIVRLVCDAFPAVPPRAVMIQETDGRMAQGGR